jgi:hypothetical protein
VWAWSDDDNHVGDAEAFDWDDRLWKIKPYGGRHAKLFF